MGATIFDAVVGLLLDLLAAKIREKIDKKKFEERMRELQPRIEQRMQKEYDSWILAKRDLKAQGPLYFNIEILVITETTIYVAGAGSNTIPGSPTPEILNVKISSQNLNSAGPVQETVRRPSPADPVLFLKQTQVLTYSESITPP